MTDPFTTAARAEAGGRWPRVDRRNKSATEWLDEGMASGFVLGAQWARDHLAAQEVDGLDDAETYRKIAAEIEWHIRTASARGYARAKGTDLPDGVIDAQIESAVRAITTIAARAAQRDEEAR